MLLLERREGEIEVEEEEKKKREKEILVSTNKVRTLLTL